jgi:hypothetical protein
MIIKNVYWIDNMYESGSSAGEQYSQWLCFQKFSCEHRIGEVGEATQRARARTQSKERPRSNLVGRIRITGFGWTGQVMHWCMGGILTERTKNRRQFSVK